MVKNKRNKLILAILFFGPLIFYLFLLTGTNNFAKLPVLTSNVNDVSNFTSENEITLEKKISVLCFFGKDLLHKKTNALNLNEKIYKHFYGFKDFQFVVVLPKGMEEDAKQLKKELGVTTNVDKWFFIFGIEEQVLEMFNSLQTNYKLDANFYSPNAFIIDREMRLRGRNDDEDEVGKFLYGYNAENVAPIHQKMVDDLKVVIAEYRLALKKNKKESWLKK
ncbi:MAG: hypothetical protein L3J08_05745 [Flavobacteriaceae bacterium]|nr:hypothetical protein [Flavobacteriaceae bacterium]